VIQSVNSKEFEAFGTVISGQNQLSAQANAHSVACSSSETAVYETVAETWLGYETGMSVLSISTENGIAQDFYLDRTLRLKPGVRFSVTALGGRAVIQMAGFSMPRLLQSKASDRLEMRQKLKVTRLCAFLCQEREHGFLLPGEAHPFLEFVYVDEGALHSVADGQEILLAQGDLVLYDRNQWHTQYADLEVAPKLLTISFDAEGMDLSRLYNRRLRLPQKAVALLQEMLREQARRDGVSEDMLIALLQVFLLILLRDEERQLTALQTEQYLNSENQVIRQAQQYIAANVMGRLSVPLVAENAGVSASYLTALFHKHLTISPGEYIRRIKLQKSKQLIQEGQMNFTEIARALEYSTIHHFSRQFKQTFGITPSEYARTVQ